MERVDVLVAGAGISGASFAFHAARGGRSVLVIERESRAGGCLATERTAAGFWYELGAHTCYNSYGALLEVLEGAGRMDALLARGRPVLRFLDGNALVPGENLGLFLRRFDKLELLRSLPRWIGARAEGRSVREHYGRLVGARNYERVLAPMLAAVPSQPADDFPADMLFKKRPRRRDVRRSFTLEGGLRSAVEGALRHERIETRTGLRVERLERTGERFAVSTGDGKRIEASVLALAVSPGEAARLLAPLAPELAEPIRGIREVCVDSLGFAVRRERVALPYATFLIPLADSFHSIVTRDVVADRDWRAFTLHFRPGTTSEERRRRACEVLGLAPEDMHSASERRSVLPSPRRGHAQIVQALDRLLASRPLALTGNWFGGLAIEDCAARSRSEWHRVAALAVS